MPGKSLKRQILEQTIKQAVDEATGAAESRYLKAFDRRAHGYALLGHTDEEIAELIGVSRSTFDTWLVEQPSLRTALRKARVDDHVRLVKSLHRAGNGFRAKETKLNVVGGRLRKTVVTRVYPPNVAASQLVLVNRQGARWKDTKTVEHTGKVDLLAAIERSLGGDDAKAIGSASLAPAEPEEAE